MDPVLDEPPVSYSLSQYLLDRVNIHDTIARLVSIYLSFLSEVNCDWCAWRTTSRRILIAEISSALEMKSLPPLKSQ